MKIKKQELYKSIMSLLAMLEVQIQYYNSEGLRDIDMAMEDLVCDLLNLTYGYELDNLNKVKMNYPGIDLGDERNRVAVQVTAESDREKIEKTIEMFEKKGYQTTYDRLIILILGEKKNYKKGFQAKAFSFSPEEDILDFRCLVKDIGKCSTSQLDRIDRLLRSEMTSGAMNRGYQEKKTLYAREYTDHIQMEAERLYEKIRKLREKYPLSKDEFSSAANALDRIRKNRESVYSFDEEMEMCREMFFFVKELTKEELYWLKDFQVRIHPSVLNGIARWELDSFFERYDAGKTEEKIRREIENNFWYLEYTYEQMQRILRCCESMMAFDPNSVHFSSGYIRDDMPDKNLLAACFSEKERGTQNKIYVWDTENMETPAAILGGLHEQVRNIKLFRIEEDILVTAQGGGRIYIWNLQAGTYKPVSILRSEPGVSDYDLYYSKNGNWYIMGRYSNRIYLWELYGDEKPVQTTEFRIDAEDLLVVNTRLTRKSYRGLGDSIYDSLKNYKIYWLIERSELKFEIELICDKDQIIGGCCGSEKTGFNQGTPQVASELPVLGVRTTKALFLYDMCQKQCLAVLPQEGQEICDYEILVKNGEIYLMVYYLYIAYKDDGKGLVRCFSVNNGCVTEKYQWFRGEQDIQAAVTGSLQGEEVIYFNCCLDHKIYGVRPGDADARQLYAVPESMFLIDMAAIE